MSDIRIDDSKLSEAISLSESISDKVEEALQKATFVHNKLQSNVMWSGEAKDACAAYLAIIVQYHKDVNKGLKKHTKVLKKLDSNIKEYESSAEVQAIKGF